MSERVLVAYGSKHGATAEIAEAIGEVMREAGLDVDVLSAGAVKDLAPYAAVVLGSGVYVGKWLKEAAKFLEAQAAGLAQRPVWLFSSGPSGEGDPVELLKGGREVPGGSGGGAGPASRVAVLQRAVGRRRPRGAAEGLEIAGGAAACGRAHRAPRHRRVPWYHRPREAGVHRETDDQDGEGAGRRFPRLGGYSCLGFRCRVGTVGIAAGERIQGQDDG